MQTKEEKAAYNRAYHQIHKAEIAARKKAYMKTYRYANKVKIATFLKKYYDAHKPKLIARAKKYRGVNKAHVLEVMKAYRQSHKEEILSDCAKRRAIKCGVVVEKVSRAVVFERDGGRCHLCGKRVNPKGWHLDHIVPLSRGGEHSYKNVAVSHAWCNLHKNNKPCGQLRLLG